MEIEQIELVNAIPNLVTSYRSVIVRAIALHIITLEQWNMKYKFYRDDAGYSMIHYLEAYMNKTVDFFITSNPIMLNDREDLQKRFELKILTLEEFKELLFKEKEEKNGNEKN